jgi:hypothetical protein
MRDYDLWVVGAFVLIIILTRRGVQRLPGFSFGLTIRLPA